MLTRATIQRIRERAARCAPPEPAGIGLAAMLCYLDAERDERIARRLGISRRTLARWKRRPEFAAAWAAVSAFHQLQLDVAQGQRLWGVTELVPADAHRLVLPRLDRARPR